MKINGTKLLTNCMRDVDEIGPYDIPDAEQLELAVDAMNELLDELSVQRWFTPAISIKDYPFVGGQRAYTLGPTGDWEIDYPESIKRWSIVINAGSTDEYEYGRGEPVDEITWQNIQIKGTNNDYPYYLYAPGDYTEDGLTSLEFWPTPRTGHTARLYLFASRFRTLDPSREYDFPPAYVSLLRKALAVELLTVFRKPVDPLLIQQRDRVIREAKRQNRRNEESPRDPAYDFNRNYYHIFDVRYQ